MTNIAEHVSPEAAPRESLWGELIHKEDWWAIWIGLGLIVVAAALFVDGGSLRWIAVAPLKWHHPAEVAAQLREHWAQYVALLVLWGLLFGIGAKGLRIKLAQFLPVFVVLYVTALVFLHFARRLGRISHIASAQ